MPGARPVPIMFVGRGCVGLLTTATTSASQVRMPPRVKYPVFCRVCKIRRNCNMKLTLCSRRWFWGAKKDDPVLRRPKCLTPLTVVPFLPIMPLALERQTGQHPATLPLPRPSRRENWTGYCSFYSSPSSAHQLPSPPTNLTDGPPGVPDISARVIGNQA